MIGRYKRNVLLGFNVKDKTVETNFSDNIIAAIRRADIISLKYFGRTILITSGSETTTKHREDSKHYPYNNRGNKGDAFDMRTWKKWYPEDKGGIERFRDLFYSDKEFADNYDLVIEKDHIHIEYDPK